MTTLSIIANYEKKRLRCYGTVAAGEHVAVTVTDGAQWIGEGTALRLRVLFGPNIVAVFPFAEGDAWTAAGTQDADAACELNLNTLQAEKYLKHGGTCLWILDDVENHTLYATGEFDVLPWPKRRGIDEPIDLDGYPLLLDEINGLREDFEAYQQTVSQMLAAKQDTVFDLAVIRSGAAAGATAVQPSQIARFVDGAEYKQSYGELNNPAILFKHGTDVIVALDATPLVKDGMVSTVEIRNNNLVITFNTDSGKQPIEVPLTDIFDPDNYYDKNAVDGLLAGKKNNFDAGNGLVETSNTLYAYRGVTGTGTAGETRYTIGPADVGSTVYSWNGSSAVPTGETVTMINTTIGRIYTASFPNPVYYDRSAADDIARPGVISIDETVVAKKSDVPAPSTSTPSADSGSGSAGTSAAFARGDHVHPTDTSRMAATATGADIPLNPSPGAPNLNSVVNTLTTQISSHENNTKIHVTTTEKATWNGKQNALTAQQLANIAAVPSKANRAANPTAGNLAALDANGNPTDAGWTAGDLARDSLVAKTIDNGAVTLDDRAINAVAVSSSLASLTINFPTATSGKVRDFGLRLSVASGITTAPELVLPQGVTCENADGEVPEIGADGAATILYFTETAAGVFLVKGEVVTAIS